MIRRLLKPELLIAAAVSLVTVGFIGYKVEHLGYTMATIQPEKGYSVRLVIDVEAKNQPVKIEASLPIQSARQTVLDEKQSSQEFQYSITTKRTARWNSQKVTGKQRITYTFFAQTETRDYAIPPGLKLPLPSAEDGDPNVKATQRIQVDNPEIQAKALELMPDGLELSSALRAAFDFAHRGIKYENVRGPTDAVAALRLLEASCNGKNRLLVALLRARGIPARMAQGLILRNTQKRTTHAWTEVLVNGQWIPFCPTSGYFAKIPEQYLELSKGDSPVFSHTQKIGFDWKWIIQAKLNHTEQAVWNNVNNPLNILNYWVSMQDFHIPLRLIMIVLLVPIAGSVITVARNVLGLVPFGTFMPALVAVSFQDTGFIFGSAMFLVIVLVASGLNALLLKLKLLHIPRLAIILTAVVVGMMFFSIVAVKVGLTHGAGISLFPMAILTLTTERFTQTIMEDSWREAIKRVSITYVVSAACFFIISRQWLQVLIAAFPELLFINMAFNLVIGSWTGLRLMEYLRFRYVLSSPTAAGRLA